MDYGTLAHLEQPQMMPNAPNGMAGMLYYQDKARQDAALKQATMAAQLNAQQEAMKAEEFSRGSPGRNATIDTGNAMAQGGLTNVPQALETQRNQADTGVSKSRNEKIMAAKELFGQYADRWATAKSEDEKSQIMDEMDDEGQGKLGGKSVRDIPRDKLDKIMANLRESRIATPGQVGKERIEEAKGNWHKEIAKTSAESREKTAKIAAALKEQLAKTGALAKLQDPDRVIFNMMMKNAKSDEDIADASTWYQEAKLARDKARAGAGPQRLDIQVPEGSGVTTRQPPVPQAVRPKNTGFVSPKNALPKEEAQRVLAGFKGTKQYEAAKKFYEDTYGESAP